MPQWRQHPLLPVDAAVEVNSSKNSPVYRPPQKRESQKNRFRVAKYGFSVLLFLWSACDIFVAEGFGTEPLVVGVIARYDDHGAGIPFETAIRLGVKAIQIKAPYPENRTPEVAAEILGKCAERGIVLTSMQSGFTGESYKTIPEVQETVGLVPKGTRQERMEQFLSVCEFAQMLGLDTVCFHIGFVPHETDSVDYREMVAVTRTLCDYAQHFGQKIHLETGQEPGEVLKQFIEEVQRDNLFINFDPANLILYGCGDPIETLQVVGAWVKSVHCKDAIYSDQPGITWGTEVPFGTGQVDARRFLETLRAIGFDGALIVERENRGDPERQSREAAAAAEWIEKIKADIWK